MDRFAWTEASETAAELVAKGDLARSEIAERLGIGRTTLFRWSKHPDFVARVDELLTDYREEVRTRGTAVRERRVAILNDLWERLIRVVSARAESGKWDEVPGGDTGLIVHRIIKRYGRGDQAVSIEGFDIDAVLIREIRETLKHVAVELGQWSEKSETVGKVTIEVKYADAVIDIGQPASGSGSGLEGSQTFQRALDGPEVG